MRNIEKIMTISIPVYDEHVVIKYPFNAAKNEIVCIFETAIAILEARLRMQEREGKDNKKIFDDFVKSISESKLNEDK